MDLETLEANGAKFSVDALMDARRNTKEAIALIASGIKPGMSEDDARPNSQGNSRATRVAQGMAQNPYPFRNQYCEGF